jgi:hypothetical protein
MVGLLGRPRRMRAFVSSTLRGFVVRKLEALGFDVVSMETDCKNEFDWQRWSQNQAGQCDLFIFLFGNRIENQQRFAIATKCCGPSRARRPEEGCALAKLAVFVFGPAEQLSKQSARRLSALKIKAIKGEVPQIPSPPK